MTTMYFEVNNITDFLFLHFISQQEKLKIKLGRENVHPWQLWGVVFESIENDLLSSFPLKKGTPKSKLITVKYTDILKKIGIEVDEEKRIAQNVFIKTKDKNIFVHILHKHFLLQQGKTFFCGPEDKDKIFFIKISSPSLWCLGLLKDLGEYELYNETYIDGVFVEHGWQLQTSLNTSKLNLQQNTVLINRSGEIESYNLDWKPVNDIVDIKMSDVRSIKATFTEKLEIEPRFISDEYKLPSLWKVDDSKKLIRLLSETPYEQLSGFDAWFGEESIYILSKGIFSNGVFSSLLTNIFPGYVCYQNYVFLPQGKMLLPKLPENLLLDACGVKNSIVCFNEEENSLNLLVLPIPKSKPLEFFLKYKVQKTIRELDFFADSWSVEFSDLIPDPLMFEKQVKSSKILPSVDKDMKPKKSILSQLMPKSQVIKPNIQKFMSDLLEIDTQLVADIGNAELWLKRSMLSQELGNSKASILAELIHCIRTRNHKELFSVLEKNKDFLGVSELFSQDRENVNPGQILTQIRNHNNHCAELSYCLQLYFSECYKDKDVLNNALNFMRSGFSGTSFEFYIFEDFNDFIEDESHSTAKVDKDLNYIEKIVQDFVSRLEKCTPRMKAIIQKQFDIILTNNVKKSFIPPLEIDVNNCNEVEQKVWQYLNLYPKFDPNKTEDSVKAWLEKLSMKDLKNLALKDVLTGDLQRPIFPDKDNLLNKAKAIYENYCSGKPWESGLEKSGGLDNAENQRKLLYIVTQYSPLDVFEKYIASFEFNSFASLAFSVILNCDIYRLNLIYKRKMKEGEFFTEMIKVLPDDGCSLDFYDGMRNVIFCLFLSSYSDKQSIFYDCLEKIIPWLSKFDSNLDDICELLSLIALLQVGIINYKFSDNIAVYNFYARKKSLWMDHANYVFQNGWTK